MATKVFQDIDQMSEAVAIWMVSFLQTTLKEKETATVVLSGGSTPKKLYTLLASDRFKDEVEWSRLFFFWGDERYVPFSDERNNARMAIETLLSKVGVKEGQIFKMDTSLPAPQAAAEYEQQLKQFFPDATTTFDLVFMGMGNDGHTLSLFPYNKDAFEKDKWVFSTYVEQQKENRITLSATAVNLAEQVVFLVAGADKAEPLKEVLFGDFNPNKYPSQLIRPLKREPIWFLDKTAAEKLG